MPKAKHPDIVEMFEQQESRQLTLPELINRFLMRVEQGGIATHDRDGFIQQAAAHFSVPASQVATTLDVQADKRVEALTEHAARLKALLSK